MDNQLKMKIDLLLDELKEIEQIEAIKRGSRNNQEDQTRIQKIHDLTNEMGVKCDEKKSCTMKEGARFSKDDFEMVKTLHDHAVNLGAQCGTFVGGIAPGVDTSVKGESLYCKYCDFKASIGSVPDLLCPQCKERLFLKIAEREDVTPESGKNKYGDVTFADEKNKKYPIDNEKHIRAAWSYINKKKNAGKYSAEDLASIKKKIIAAWHKVIDKEWKPDAAKSVNLQDVISDVRNEFYEEFNYSQQGYPSNVSQPWVVEVYDDKVIVCSGEVYYEVGYSKDANDEYQFSPREDWIEVEKDFVPVKTENLVVASGCEVKAGVDDNHIGGYCVKFSDKDNLDSTGDYFDKSTNYEAKVGDKGAIYLHHCLPIKMASGMMAFKEKIGIATIKAIDDSGIDVDGELFDALVKANDTYKKKLMKTVKKAIKAGAMGWSTGTASHLVEREKAGNGFHIKRWVLGLDYTITPTPAGLMQGVPVELKSIEVDMTKFDSDEPETAIGAQKSVAVVSDEAINNIIKFIVDKKGETNNMENKDIHAIAEAVKTQLDAETKAKADAEAKAKADQAAFKTMLTETLTEMGIKPSKSFPQSQPSKLVVNW